MLLERIWKDKILRDHAEMTIHLEAVLTTVANPDHVAADRRPGRTLLFRRGVGPSRWLVVVVSYEQEPARVITALANRKDPDTWKP